MDFRFALVTDLHFGPRASFEGKLRKLSHKARELTDAFVERMNSVIHPEFIVNLGDDIEDENEEADLARYTECNARLRRANARLVNVAGNHDTVSLTERQLLGIWDQKEASKLYYSFDTNDHHFVVLHTRERKDLDVSLGQEQLEWLEADLGESRYPTIVFMHHSAAEQRLAGNRWFEGKPNICLVRERRALRAILARHANVRAVFNGHLHWNHFDMIAGVAFVTVQSLIENIDEDAPGRPAAAHAVVTVSRKRLLVEVEGEDRARYQVEF